ncbi:hypothetical protein GGX14DRAFT_586056 [Mycena pura]|uniref:DUF6535 domain-containing protein n=1 Tax=Mycena pura TaxID=153505 RepID=A0AAD6VQT3_9AGAR|nr:hypothetical protein GGX14DRAFT_586056 [Mycena pura]
MSPRPDDQRKPEMGGVEGTKAVNPSQRDEAASAKLWTVYISEAEKYDRALVESWRGNMEGMLIFAGLFSASLTAFLIESYKSLIPDSGAQTARLVSQISQQLAASANGTAFVMPPSVPFTPPVTSLVCNALWFISLGLSLSCALMATLLEQWARDFLHKAEMRSSPVIRARIFSYLYYGLKRFHMHTVVEVIPLLLHASLLFFFAGLIAFLVPVNIAITGIAGIILLVVIVVYSVITLLPLRHLDCPYRTPLSGAFWRLVHVVQRIQHNRRISAEEPTIHLQTTQDETMVEAMSRTATEISDERLARDTRALVWTVKSLKDEAELEPFIEAIPDLLWDPAGRRYIYQTRIISLAQNPEVQLHHRIATLLESCNTGLLSLEAGRQRRIVCLKALWAIASFSEFWQKAHKSRPAVDFSSIFNHPIFEETTTTLIPNPLLNPETTTTLNPNPLLHPEIAPYFISAKIMMRWSSFCALQGRFVEWQQYLMACELERRNGRFLDLSAVSFSIYATCRAFDFWSNDELSISGLQKLVQGLRFHIPYTILFEYLSKSVTLSSPPYRFYETWATISVDVTVNFLDFQEPLEKELRVAVSAFLQRSSTAADNTAIDWAAGNISALLAMWRPDDTTPIPTCVIHLLNGCSDATLEYIMRNGGDILTYLWSSFPNTLDGGLLSKSSNQIREKTAEQKGSLTALWRLASLCPNTAHHDHSPWPLRCYKSVLSSLVDIDFSGFICKSISALVKSHIISEDVADPGNERSPRIYSQTMGSTLSDKDHGQNGDMSADSSLNPTTAAEAILILVAEFLDHCNSDLLPYKAGETVRRIGWFAPHQKIHRTHQIRFASSLYNILSAGRFAGLMEDLVYLRCLNSYAREPSSSLQEVSNFDGLHDWLDDPVARQKIKAGFLDFEIRLNTKADSPKTLARLRKILHQLDSMEEKDQWHDEGDERDHQRLGTSHKDETRELGAALPQQCHPAYNSLAPGPIFPRRVPTPVASRRQAAHMVSCLGTHAYVNAQPAAYAYARPPQRPPLRIRDGGNLYVALQGLSSIDALVAIFVSLIRAKS